MFSKEPASSAPGTPEQDRPGWWTRRGSALARASAAAVPVAMVNGTAFIGQFAFIRDHVPWIMPGQIMVAATFESVAVYLAWHAHIAAMRNDSATRLKMGASLFAVVMGLMNYSHYSHGWLHPTVMAVGMFFMSSLSPWLWGIHTRRASRDELLARGLIEEHAVRLGATRWTWHVLRSMRVMYWATWHGINDPKRAIAHFEERWGTADTPLPVKASRAGRAVPEIEAVPEASAPEPELTVPDEEWHAFDPSALAALSAGTQAVPEPTVPEQEIESPAARQALGDGTGVLVGTPEAPQAVMTAGPEPEVAVAAEANLTAEAKVKGFQPSKETVAEVELWLAGLPLDQLPSRREVARRLGNENLRRQGKKLLDARTAAGTGLSEAPAIENRPRSARNGAGDGSPVMIATPNSIQPGGRGGTSANG